MRSGALGITRRRTIAAGVGLLAGLAVWPFTRQTLDEFAIRAQPLRFDIIPFRVDTVCCDQSLFNVVRRRLQLRPEMTLSDLLHWLRIFGNSASIEFQRQTSREVLELVTNGNRIEERFGQRGVIVRTRDGVRYLSRLGGVDLVAASRPAHPYQELAVFAELGLPSSTAIVTADGDFTVRDLMQDCLSNLQLREADRQEPEWATVAIAHYLTPTSTWTNRWGEELSVEKWTGFLVRRDISRFSCGGTHVLHSLGLLLQLHSRHPFMNCQLLDKVRNTCRDLFNEIESSQAPNGAFPRPATIALQASGIDWDIHITGHILESLLYFPDDLRISNVSVLRGLRFLAEAYRRSTDSDVSKNYCTYSHSGQVLLKLDL